MHVCLCVMASLPCACRGRSSLQTTKRSSVLSWRPMLLPSIWSCKASLTACTQVRIAVAVHHLLCVHFRQALRVALPQRPPWHSEHQQSLPVAAAVTSCVFAQQVLSLLLSSLGAPSAYLPQIAALRFACCCHLLSGALSSVNSLLAECLLHADQASMWMHHVTLMRLCRTWRHYCSTSAGLESPWGCTTSTWECLMQPQTTSAYS